MNTNKKEGPVENGFHDFSDPRKALDNLFEKFKEWSDSGYEGDMERLFDTLSVSLMHVGIDKNVYEIAVPYSAALHAMGEHGLARAMQRVTMRIGRHTLAVAYSVRSDLIEWSGIDEVPQEQRNHMTEAISCVLMGMGADVKQDGESLTITGWDCDDPTHDHPIHSTEDGPIKMNIDHEVSKFREELDREFGDSTNPASKWMTPRKDDE